MVFFCNGPFSWLVFKNIMKSPLVELKITFFILLYTYIVLHSHVKSCKHVYFYIYIVLWDCVKLYKHIYYYTYMECKSQTILHAQHWFKPTFVIHPIFRLKFWIGNWCGNVIQMTLWLLYKLRYVHLVWCLHYKVEYFFRR
jgi:hypothetical protein